MAGLTVYLENYRQFIIESLVFYAYFQIVNTTVLLSVAQIPVVALMNGEQLPVTLPLARVHYL